jgi:hypothetical protein
LYEHDRKAESEIKNGKNERCKMFEYFPRPENEKYLSSWKGMQAKKNFGLKAFFNKRS